MQHIAAVGYQQASSSKQKVDGEDFIQTDVCPKAGETILDLGCGKENCLHTSLSW